VERPLFALQIFGQAALLQHSVVICVGTTSQKVSLQATFHIASYCQPTSAALCGKTSSEGANIAVARLITPNTPARKTQTPSVKPKQMQSHYNYQKSFINPFDQYN